MNPSSAARSARGLRRRTPGRARWVWPGLAALLLAGVAALLVRPAEPSKLSQAAPQVGHPAPDFALPTLAGDTAGKDASLRQFLGRPMLLQFWAVDCPSCAAERAALLRASRSFTATGGRVLGVDAYLEPPGMVGPYVKRYKEPYTTILLDPDGRVILGAYHIVGVPTSFFIDAHGIIRSIVVGQTTQAVFSRAFQQIGGANA